MRYPGLMAKVKSLNSKILTLDEIDRFIAAKDLSELIRIMKENPKYSLSKEKDLTKLHRRDIEVLLKTKMIDDFYNIFFYLPAEGKKFFKFMEKRFELENIKYVFRLLHGGNAVDETKFFPVKYPCIDPKKLLSLRTLEDLLKLLKDSMYYSAIESVYENYNKTKRVELFLNALDLWYLTKMKNVLKSLPGYGGGLRKIFYTQIDLTNIEWIYRAKILFGFESHEALNYIIPIQGKLTKEELTKLASSKDVDDFMNNLALTQYGKYFQKIPKEDLSYLFQRVAYRVLLDCAKSLLAHTDNGLDVLGGYLYVREYEYMDMVMIIESKRYSIPKEKAQSFLILRR